MYRGHGQCVEPRRTREREREGERRPRVPANPSPVIKRFGEQPVRKIVNESPWTVRPMTQLGRAIYLGQSDRTGRGNRARFTWFKIEIRFDSDSVVLERVNNLGFSGGF